MAPKRGSNSTASYPPQSINIRGSGGPYVVVVGNVAKGTTTEDIQLTFEPFGPVETVRERVPPSLNYPSLSFEVSFARRDDANAACASLNGCLADGRVLSVAPRSQDLGPAQSAFTGQTSAAVRDRLNSAGRLEPGPAPLPRKREPEPLARVPVPKKDNKRPTTAAPAALPQQPKPKPTQPAKPAASLQKRMGLGESPAEKKARAVKKAAKATKAGKLSTTPSLKSRITIPLSERIGSGATQSDPMKREKLPPAKALKAKKAAAAKETPSKSARKRANKRAKAAAAGADGMDLD